MKQGGDVGGVIKHPGGKHHIEVVFEKDVLFPGQPFLKLSLYVHPYFAEIILERQDNSLYSFALFFYGNFQSQ